MFTGKLKFVQSFSCEAARSNPNFVMADYVREMVAQTCCKYSKFGSIEHLLFLSKRIDFFLNDRNKINKQQ